MCRLKIKEIYWVPIIIALWLFAAAFGSGSTSADYRVPQQQEQAQ